MAYTTLSDVFQNARFRTGTSTSDFADSSAPLLSLTNKHLRKIVTALRDNNEDWYAVITNVSLSSGVQAYALSSDSSTSGGGNLQVNRLEITYDGTNWCVGTPLDLEQIGDSMSTMALVNNEFSTSEPYYAIYGNSIYTFPVATTDVASAMRVYEVVRQGEVTNASVTFNAVTNASFFNMPKEFMEPLEDYLTADLYERIGKIQEATVARQTADTKLDGLRREFQPRNQDFDLNVGTNAYHDYGE